MFCFYCAQTSLSMIRYIAALYMKDGLVRNRSTRNRPPYFKRLKSLAQLSVSCTCHTLLSAHFLSETFTLFMEQIPTPNAGPTKNITYVSIELENEFELTSGLLCEMNSILRKEFNQRPVFFEETKNISIPSN